MIYEVVRVTPAPGESQCASLLRRFVSARLRANAEFTTLAHFVSHHESLQQLSPAGVLLSSLLSSMRFHRRASPSVFRWCLTMI